MTNRQTPSGERKAIEGQEAMMLKKCERLADSVSQGLLTTPAPHGFGLLTQDLFSVISTEVERSRAAGAILLPPN
jgi:hypothetical protein